MHSSRNIHQAAQKLILTKFSNHLYIITKQRKKFHLNTVSNLLKNNIYQEYTIQNLEHENNKFNLIDILIQIQ